MKQVVFFDAAHTLIEPHPPSALVYAEIGRRHGLEITEAGLRDALRPMWWKWRAAKNAESAVAGTNENLERAWWLRLVDQAFREAGEPRGVTEACFDEIFRHFALGSAWRVFPEVRGVLASLRERGVGPCVLSNFDWRLRPVLAEHRLDSLFDRIFISSEVGWEKPSPRIYTTALEAVGVPAGDALMVGDDWEHDVQGPVAVGIQGVWLRRDGRPEERPHVTSLEGILDLL